MQSQSQGFEENTCGLSALTAFLYDFGTFGHTYCDYSLSELRNALLANAKRWRTYGSIIRVSTVTQLINVYNSDPVASITVEWS